MLFVKFVLTTPVSETFILTELKLVLVFVVKKLADSFSQAKSFLIDRFFLDKISHIIEIENDGYDDKTCEEDREFFLWRDTIFKTFSDKSIAITDRIGIKNEMICSKELLNKYLTLEILDSSWQANIEELIKAYDDIRVITISKEFDDCFEQLLLYFSYRHLPLLLDGKDDNNILNFIKSSTSVIFSLCQLHIKQYGKLTIDDIIEYSRMYSSEIEYSQENLDALI